MYASTSKLYISKNKQAYVAWACICKRLRSPGIDSKEPIPLANVAWARICKHLRSPEKIDSKEPIPLSNVAWARICKRVRSFRAI